MKAIKRIYEGVITFQLVLFGIFLIENANSLSQIEFSFDVMGSDYAFSLNLYSVLVIAAGIFAIMLLASFSFGFNEEGTKNTGKFISFLALTTFLTLSSSYYILQLGSFGLILEMVFMAVYIFYYIDSTGGAD